MENELKKNIDKIHTTIMGEERLRKNLDLKVADVVAWCRQKILQAKKIERIGKNYYVYIGDATLTVNASSWTIITGHK